MIAALLAIYTVAVLAAAWGVWMAFKCCNGIGECGQCTARRKGCALAYSVAVPAAVAYCTPMLWRTVRVDTSDDLARAQATVYALPKLWDTVAVLTVRYACCDASTAIRVGFVDYVVRHLEVPGTMENIVRG